MCTYTSSLKSLYFDFFFLRRHADGEGALETALRQGLARFHIEDDMDENHTDTFHWNSS